MNKTFDFNEGCFRYEVVQQMNSNSKVSAHMGDKALIESGMGIGGIEL